MSLTYSNAALCLTVVPLLVHGVEALFPMLVRFVANWITPVFAPGLPNPDKMLTYEEQMVMLEAAIDAAPSEKWVTAADMVFVLTFETRQCSCCFWSLLIGAIYGFTLPLAQRHPLHMVNMALDVLMFAGNANHAGVPLLGFNPMVSTNGRNIGILFAPFWALNFYLNYMSYKGSKEALAKSG